MAGLRYPVVNDAMGNFAVGPSKDFSTQRTGRVFSAARISFLHRNATQPKYRSTSSSPIRSCHGSSNGLHPKSNFLASKPLAAFNKSTGELHWKVARNYKTPTEGDHGYATPLLIQHEGRDALLAWGGQHLTAHDAADGKLLWDCGDFNPDATDNWPAVASPMRRRSSMGSAHLRSQGVLLPIDIRGRGLFDAGPREVGITDKI